MRRGCLWNSFVMVGRVGAFVNMIRQTLPGLLTCFESMWAEVAPGMEDEALRDLYLKVPATNFSDEVLSKRPSDLAVLRADALGWSDLGEPQRVFSVIKFKDMVGNRESEWLGQGLSMLLGGAGSYPAAGS